MDYKDAGFYLGQTVQYIENHAPSGGAGIPLKQLTRNTKAWLHRNRDFILKLHLPVADIMAALEAADDAIHCGRESDFDIYDFSLFWGYMTPQKTFKEGKKK